MKRNNFIIAGLGSSGTLFLAKLMDRSEHWHVVHMGICQSFDMDGTTPVTTQPLLDARPRYFGDVNGLLLFHLLELQVGRKAVIIRNPRDTLLSWYCDAKGRLPPSFFSIYAGGYFALEECLEHGVPCIRFEKMVTDADYLRRILRYFGILDVTPTPPMLAKKVNTKRTSFCPSYEAIDASTRERFARAVGGFEEKYYGGGPVLHADDFVDVGDEGLGDPDGPELDEVAVPADPVATRSTTLFADPKGHEPVSLQSGAVARLAPKLGLAAPDDPAAQRKLVQVQVSPETITLFVDVATEGTNGILIERRRDGAPYFARTRHLHFSYLGNVATAEMQKTIASFVRRLGRVSFEQLRGALASV